ncbi:MAG: alpha/beta fold hydrolase [Phycisphaerae bacterium]|nr:alpha/beta fold hydrolase [Phycisphaerae bacterium]
MHWPGLLFILSVGLALAWLAAVLHVLWVLSKPPRHTFAWALARGWPKSPDEIPAVWGGPRPFESWSFRTRGSDLPVWDVPGDDPRGPIVILSHGWGESRLECLARLGPIAEASARVLLWDMPAHGEAPHSGRCALGAREPDDLRALIEHLTGPRRQPDQPPLVLVGFSLGAGVSLAAAAADPRIAAVIAEAPYRLPQTPARNVLHAKALPHRLVLEPALCIAGWINRAGARWLAPDGPFDRAALAAQSYGPVTVIHGTDDAVCPLADGQAIARSATNGRLIAIASGEHVNLWLDPRLRAQTAAAVQAALRAVTLAQPPAHPARQAPAPPPRSQTPG